MSAIETPVAKDAALPLPAALITASEFACMPNPDDGSHQELIRGEIVTMPLPQGRHGLVQGEICAILREFVKKHGLGRVVVESGVHIKADPDTVLGPDVSFISLARHPERPMGYFEIPPDLVVEVLSPDDRKALVRDKIRICVNAGVKLIWLVDPEDQTVTVYQGNMRGVQFDETDALDGGDVLPGFTCRIADFFA